MRKPKAFWELKAHRVPPRPPAYVSTMRMEQMLAEAEGRYAATDEVHAKHFGWVLRQYRAHPG